MYIYTYIYIAGLIHYSENHPIRHCKNAETNVLQYDFLLVENSDH